MIYTAGAAVLTQHAEVPRSKNLKVETSGAALFFKVRFLNTTQLFSVPICSTLHGQRALLNPVSLVMQQNITENDSETPSRKKKTN